jgi:hypothetical protein
MTAPPDYPPYQYPPEGGTDWPPLDWSYPHYTHDVDYGLWMEGAPEEPPVEPPVEPEQKRR